MLAVLCLCAFRPAAAQSSAEKLVDYLADPSYKIRLKAAIQIGKMKITSAAPALRKALDDENDTVRAAAALSLGKLGDQESRSELVGLLSHPKNLVWKAAEKSLVLLDRANGAPRYLVALQEPVLAKGVPASRGRRLLRAIKAKLKRNSSVTFSAGEEKILQGKRLAAHLERRRLKGMLLQPRILRLSVNEGGGGTAFSCKVSVMVVAMPNNRMEFAGSGDADAEVGETGLDPDTIDDIETRVLDASTEAAADEVMGYLARRTGP